ncbi:MAG: hypothetical protein ACOY90_22455 [Candidatus Zhuqueibacterota bacterium]
MEYIVFRTMRMIEREISLYRDLYACLCNQQQLIIRRDILDLLMVMVEQKELTSEIRLVENDIMEELKEMAIFLAIDLPANKELSINEVVTSLQENYKELAEMIKTRCWVLTILVKKANAQNEQNMDALRDCLALWKNDPSILDFWQEIGDANAYERVDELLAFHSSSLKNELIKENECPFYTTA